MTHIRDIRYSWRNNTRQRYPSDYQPGVGNNGYKSAAGRGNPSNRQLSGVRYNQQSNGWPSYKHGFDK